ncbi:ABC transporter substrate-binding protein [Thiohalocapsa marina]|uniref:High-affinity zinc uptake system protein ZnuA n=2 Tax=Thiohalocapsa marina TaxID=424902 RepID=A0A5M8FUP4_9GAMM|nr:ABC transporter substrate-binding protein [Thiohalocapsa marina]
MQQAVAESPLSVFVSVLPMQTLVERVGGDRVQVQTMVLPGQSPHSYEPSPRQLAALSEADLYVRAGLPFEAAWMPRFRSANPAMAVLDVREGLPLRPQEAHDHAHEHEHEHAHAHQPEQSPDHRQGSADPDDDEAMDAHVWTSPALVRQIARALRDTLSRLDPDGASLYAQRQAAFDAELAALDQELAAILRNLDNRSFLVYHPAWGYFADRYHLTQIPIEREGKEPGARRLAALIEQARAAGTRLILVQPQFDRRAAGRVAQAIGGRVEAVDPLAPDLADNLRRLAELIAAANGRQSPAASRQPPATSHQPPATSHQPPATSHQPARSSGDSYAINRCPCRAGGPGSDGRGSRSQGCDREASTDGFTAPPGRRYPARQSVQQPFDSPAPGNWPMVAQGWPPE